MVSKEQQLARLCKKMAKADLPLKATAKNLVFGDGSADPKVLFVGEAPGKNEDEQGLPFVGMAGQQLNALLHSIAFDRKDVYITSIIKYRPPHNRPPLPSEIQAHTPYLADQIRILKPPLIVTLGNFATRYILSGLNPAKMSKVPGITLIHGKTQHIPFEGMALNVLPVFHPAAVLYRRPLLKTLQTDFLKIPAHIE